jgi:hypothetical protein
MAHLLGYAWVSTAEQSPDLQLDALRSASCYRLFVDAAIGALDERPELAKSSTNSGHPTPLLSGSSTDSAVRCAT